MTDYIPVMYQKDMTDIELIKPKNDKLDLLLERRGKDVIHVIVGKAVFSLPSTEYVNELKDKIDTLTREQVRLINQIKKIHTAHNSLIRVVDNLKTELKHKVSKRDGPI